MGPRLHKVSEMPERDVILVSLDREEFNALVSLASVGCLAVVVGPKGVTGNTFRKAARTAQRTLRQLSSERYNAMMQRLVLLGSTAWPDMESDMYNTDELR